MTISATTQGIKPGVCLSTSRPVNPFDGQVIYMTDVDQTAVWDGTQWTVLAPIAGGRNSVINGAFNVWQRGTSFNGSAPYYGADRWFFARPGAVAGSTLSRQSSGLTGFTYCARMQRDSGNTNTSAVRIFQSLETINSLQFAGKQITVSFYVRSGANYSGGANTYLNVGSGTGTDQQLGNTGYTGYALVSQLAITPTTTWTRYSTTGSVSSSATEIGFEINFTPTGTAGANDYIEITGIQLEAGAVATPFEFEDYSETLAKCQRYYLRSFCNYLLGAVRDANLPYFTKQFPVTMRVAPSLSSNYTTRAPALAPAAAGEIGFYGNGWYTGSGGTAVNVDNGDTEQLSFYFTGWTGTAGQDLTIISSPYTWFAFSAEL
jgi:hypothetical protein